MLNIEEPYLKKYAFLQLAFRPFFAAALGFSSLAVFIWMLLYQNGWDLPGNNYSTVSWHAHEMIFGYALAAVAGFLLTAIKNWTQLQTLQNRTLLLLVLLWLIPRLLPFTGNHTALIFTAVIDELFLLMLFVSAVRPVIQTKQWKQVGIVSKLLLIAVSNLFFYLSLFDITPGYEQISLYCGFYLVLALILTMIRRLIPFFIEKGIDQSFQARNNKWVDITSLILFLAFALADLMQPLGQLVAILGVAQFAVHSYRIQGWYHSGIWKKPLLWSIYVAYAWIILGFLLKSASIWLELSPFLAMHSFAYGGIGMLTLGMMTRVALGHTGRNVFNPPKILNTVFGLLMVGAFFRIIIPLLEQQHYSWWIGIAQVLWVIAFTIVFIVYLPMLLKARVDKRPG